MSIQQNIREQIINRCNRIATLVEKDAAGIILENEQRQLHQLLSQYEQTGIISEPRLKEGSYEEENAWVDYCLTIGHVSKEQWRKINR